MRHAFGLILLLACGATWAGVHTDEMAKCLVASTSQKDRSELARWIFASAALHPEVRGMVSVPAAAREQLNQAAARLLERLLTGSCGKQTAAAITHDGRLAFEMSYQVLAHVALKELMTNKAVMSGFEAFKKHVETARIEALLKKK
jgi:hypothetical protein